MKKIVNLILICIYILQQSEAGRTITYHTNRDCLVSDNIIGIEQCQLCTRKNNRRCFSNGVFHRFFQCSNLLDGNDYSCDATNNSTIAGNVLTILPPTTEIENQDAQDWNCYFDITFGEKSSEDVTRFYLSKDSGCSNSTTLTVGKLNAPFQYGVHSRPISGKSMSFEFFNILQNHISFSCLYIINYFSTQIIYFQT